MQWYINISGFSNEEEHHIYQTRHSVGTMRAGSLDNGVARRPGGILTMCLRYCCCGLLSPPGQEPRARYNGALPSQSSDDEMLRMANSRSCNALYPDNRPREHGQRKQWPHSNGYKARSTEDLIECPGDSVYTILIQFPACSLPDTTAADTTSITMLSDDMDTPTMAEHTPLTKYRSVEWEL